MPYQIISGEYLSSKWYAFPNSPTVQTKKTINEAYETLGIFSQGTNWEKVFALGDKINSKLKTTEQEVVDDIINFRKRKTR